MKKTIISLVFVFVSILGSIWVYPQLPNHIVTNAGYNPVVTSKLVVAWGMPVVMIIIFITMNIIRNITKKNSTYARNESPLLAILNVTLLVLLLVHALILMYGLDYNINVNIIGPLVTGMVFLAMGNYLPQMSDSAVKKGKVMNSSINYQTWRKTKNFMSRAFVVGGTVILLGTFVPGSALLPVFIILLMATLLVVSGGTYFYYVKKK